MTQAETDLLIHQFKTGTLAKQNWTHDAHLTIAICFLSQYEFNDAVCRIRSGIIILNNCHGTINDGNSGYHETITVFWAKIISLFLELHKNAFLEDVIKDFLSSPLARKTLPFDFYERNELLSSSYRAVFHTPSKCPLSVEVIGNILKVRN